MLKPLSRFPLALAVTLTSATVLFSAGPKFTAKQELVFPEGYRNWVFLSSGIGMAYGPAARESSTPLFDNVFVEPKAHAEFLKSGKWPEGTMFVLELRRSMTGQSINATGRSQGDIAAVEMSVKDKRFTDGWGYFEFRNGAKTATVLGEQAGCNACHKANTAVENTFVQFYPTLMDVAKGKGVLKASYLEAEKKK